MEDRPGNEPRGESAFTPGTAPASGRSVGPYRIGEILGRGAMGVVYRAEHVESGETVALKTISSAKPTDLAGLRSEIHALGRMRHPGIVRILDQGVEDGTPWFAMELLGSRTLREYLRELWESPPEPPVAAAGRVLEWLTMIGRICDTLAYVHGHGLVHGDLKPANVFVGEHGRVVLADFGLVTHFGTASGREVLEVGGVIRGTAAYMAPEQIRGELIDARADLYALGCLLYEGLTGHTPFEAPDVRRLLQQHLREPTVPASQRVAEVPRALDELVLDLLAKDARARLGYADLVSRRLAELGAAVEPVAVDRPEPYLYRADLAGRGDVLGRLDARIDRALEGRGGLVFVGGESGVGKTRVVMEAATRAAEAGMRVVPAECSPEGGPLQAFRPALVALRDFCSALPGNAPSDALGRAASVLAAYEPSIGTIAAPADAPPVALSPEAERERLERSLFESLAELAARDRPILLVLDDVQWADELSLHVLDGLRRRGVERSPILVLATYRSEEVPHTLGLLIEAEGVTALSLEGLDPSSVAEIVGDMLALVEPPTALTTELFSGTAGVPFFVVEYLRLAVGERRLVRDARGAWRLGAESGSGLPRSLAELVDRRLALLEPHARDLAERASVLGNSFDETLAMAVAATASERAMEAIQQLLARHVLERDREGTLRFTHAKIREFAERRIPADAVAELHRRAARAIELLQEGRADFAAHFGRLAYHWELAGETSRMLEYLERAGRHALARSAHADAARFFDKALEAPLDDAAEAIRARRRADWEDCLAEARFALGDLRGCGAHALEAMRASGVPAPDSTAGFTLLLARQIARHLRHRLREPRPAADEETRRRLEVVTRAAARLFYLYYFTHDALRMTTMTLLTVNSAERAGRDLPVGRSYAQLGSIWAFAGLEKTALRTFARARDVARRTGDLVAVGTASIHESLHYIHHGRWPEAERIGLEALEHLRSVGDPQEAEIAETLVGHVEYYTGRLAASAARYADMATRAVSRGNVQHQAWGLYLSARARLALGETGGSLERLDRARALLEGHPDQASRVVIDGLLAVARLEVGDGDGAEKAALAAIAGAGHGARTVFVSYHGLVSGAEVCALRMAAAAGNRSVLAAALTRARGELRGMTRTFPVVRPAAELVAALDEERRGRRGRVARALLRSIESARILSMPYEEALARLWIVRLGVGDADQRSAARDLATDAFSRLGCGHHLDELTTTR